jgi:hypothetical protein
MSRKAFFVTIYGRRPRTIGLRHWHDLSMLTGLKCEAVVRNESGRAVYYWTEQPDGSFASVLPSRRPLADVVRDEAEAMNR